MISNLQSSGLCLSAFFHVKVAPSLLAATLVGGFGVAGAQLQSPTASSTVAVGDSTLEIKPVPNSQNVTLNFVNADIHSVVGAIGAMTNRTIVIDPRVRGQITLSTVNAVSREEAYRLLLSALRLQGFAMVENERNVRVVPEADAKLQGGRVSIGENQVRGDQIITQIFRLNHESVTNLVPVLRPLISPNNTITPYPANNALIITDYAENIQRLTRLINSIDVPVALDLDVIPLRHGVAIDIATMVNRLLDDAARGAALDAGQRVVLLAEQRTNSILLRAASRARADLARSLINRLDQPTQRGGNIRVVYLKNAEATRLAQTLRAIITGEVTPVSVGSSGSSNASTAGSNSDSATAPLATARNSTGYSTDMVGTQSSTAGSAGGTAGMIQADPSTNSLIINAPEPVYRNLREIIEKLDVRRVQVFIESLIVEVSADKAAEFGVQWFSGGTAGSASIVGGQVLGGAGSNLISVAANPATLGNGFSLGIVGKKLNLPGVGEVSSIGLLARALETQGNANILSTPNLLTIDNEEAKIVVGQNVPFITGQFTNTGASSGNATVNPFQTIERKDVGITLRVKPQVSDGGTVKLQVFQEVSSVVDRSLSAGIITNKRSIESNVVVDDGQIIVLGGLIEDRSSNSQDKVPGLSDMPFFGNLFRYDSRKQNKTNLMVFLRPVVIRDANVSGSVVLDRYDYMRALSTESKAPTNWALPDYAAPIPAPLNEKNTVPGNQPLIQQMHQATPQPKP
jgi:general secretion pathway protein D